MHGLKISDRDSKFFCDICCRGKLPHSTVCKKPDARARKPLDLVHSDLSGAVEPVAKDGHKYCICFVDDFSGMMFHYFLKHKSDTTRATARFIADMAHIGSIKRLRTDNGGEYVGADFKDLLIQHSIKHDPVNIVNQFSSETLQKIRLSCHEVEATIVLENVMKVYTFLRRIRYKKLTQLCVKWFQNRNRND